jgi:hypothetical protein
VQVVLEAVEIKMLAPMQPPAVIHHSLHLAFSVVVAVGKVPKPQELAEVVVAHSMTVRLFQHVEDLEQ